MRGLLVRLVVLLVCGILRAPGTFGSRETGNDEGSSDLEREKIISSCADIPENSFMKTNVLVTEDIICAETKIINVARGFNMVLRSENDIVLRNVYFGVPRTAQLTLRADRAIVLERDETSRPRPVFVVAGKLNLHASGWIPRCMAGQQDDVHGVVKIVGNGKISGKQQIKFTVNTLTVSAVTDALRESLREQQKSKSIDRWVKQATGLQQMLDARHAESNREIQTALKEGLPQRPPPSSTSEGNSNSNGKCDVGFSSTWADAASAENQDASSNAGFTPVAPKNRGKFENATTQADSKRSIRSSEGAFAGRKGSADGITSDRPASISPWPSAGLSSSPRTAPSPSPANPTGNKYFDAIMGDQYSGSPSSRSPPRVNHWVYKPRRSLKVGQVLRGPLPSADANTAIWPDLDGSVKFGRIQPSPSGGVTEESESMPSTTLIKSNAKKVLKVLNRRQKLAREVEQARNNVEKKKKSRGWTPWARRHKREAEKAKELAGEVQMTVDNRGGVEVTVDGACVLYKSGPRRWEWANRFPWRRRKNAGYEAVATKEGMEIRLGEKTVWCVKAADVE